MSDTVAVNYIGSTGGGVRPVITLKNSTKISRVFLCLNNKKKTD